MVSDSSTAVVDESACGDYRLTLSIALYRQARESNEMGRVFSKALLLLFWVGCATAFHGSTPRLDST
eukprot:56367-Eustigmatos_ZCMA.PRE.1